MSYNKSQNKYIDFKTNGKLFPSWIIKNFKKYKLPEIFRSDTDDACNRGTKFEIKKYQQFIGAFLDYKSPYHDLLLYHNIGSGKSFTAINLYNILYNYNPGWNVFILLKATLRDHPWMSELEKFLQRDEYEFRFKNIIFISYDSPTADKQFLDAIRSSDSSKKSLYIIEEAHNFIRNVYTNINSRQGRRAQTIYDYIAQDKKDNEGVRIIMLSGTPAINTPYELALMFNLLRPGTFPKSEAVFRQMFVSSSGYEMINPAMKNMFQRRIMGLVSYYIGATPDLFATKKMHYVNVEMSDYQQDIYTYFDEIEEAMAKKAATGKGGSTTYKSYTRQSANFVFPALNQNVTGENRPRPNKFKISEREALKLEEGRELIKKPGKDETVLNVQKYLSALELYIQSFDDYLYEKHQQDAANKYTLVDDFKKYTEKYTDKFNDFVNNEPKKSKVFEALHKSSAKMVNMIFNILQSPGPVLVYSNYVMMEGLQVFKIYLKYFGFSSYEDASKGIDDFRYTEYHGSISKEERGVNLEAFNQPENKYGKVIKIIMISPAGAEGLSLQNTRQVHIMEPYWHEVRINQMIGRAVRMCSHKALPMRERHVDVFRYKSIRNPNSKIKKITADQYIEDLARNKETLIQSFLDTLKEVAIDCNLFRNHNMLVDEYKCFQFEEPSLFDDQIGPSYVEDINDDVRMNNGLNSTNAQIMRIKVKKINAAKQMTEENEMGEAKYSKPEAYWFNPDTFVVYDLEFHYAIGKVGVDDDGLPKKLDKDTYIINQVIPIPMIDEDDTKH